MARPKVRLAMSPIIVHRNGAGRKRLNVKCPGFDLCPFINCVGSLALFPPTNPHGSARPDDEGRKENIGQKGESVVKGEERTLGAGARRRRRKQEGCFGDFPLLQASFF